MRHSDKWRIEKRVTYINNNNAGGVPTCIVTASAGLSSVFDIDTPSGEKVGEEDGQRRSLREEVAIIRKHIQPSFAEDAARLIEVVRSYTNL